MHPFVVLAQAVIHAILVSKMTYRLQHTDSLVHRQQRAIAMIFKTNLVVDVFQQIHRIFLSKNW